MPNVVGDNYAQTVAAMKKAVLYFTTDGPGAGTTTWTKVVAETPDRGHQGRLQVDGHLARAVSEDCELCEAAVVTKRYFEDETCWIGDCEICLVPMVVWRDPRCAAPAEDVKRHLHDALTDGRQRGVR